MADATLNEQSHFKISMPMAIQAIALVGTLVWGYSALDSRLTFVEHEVDINGDSIKEMQELQEKPIPSDIEQNQRLKYLETMVSGMNDDLEYMKRNLYGGKK